VAIAGEPTMEGFLWSPSPPYAPTEPAEDGWCLRNAMCELFRWAPDSPEWRRFDVEGPQGEDTRRLVEHLGLTLFDLSRDWNLLINHLNHPGVALFDFPAYLKSHVIYVHDMRWLVHHWPQPDGLPAQETADRHLITYGWPLFPQHVRRGPVLRAVIVDERQSPRPE
jgi:hypothetical protein